MDGPTAVLQSAPISVDTGDPVSTCIVCGESLTEVRPGVVAPFLADRIWKRPPFPASLVRCKRCEFIYFTPRLTADDESALYAAYRSAEYQQARHSTEPWYTAKLNASLFAESTMLERRRVVRDILRNNVPSSSIESVLDFGGGRGELVDGLIPNAKCFVYDIAKVETLPGVEAIELGQQQSFDLILCSNVFEHVSSPRTLLDQVLSFATEGSYVLIEVPDESPLETKTRLKRLAQLAVLLVSHPILALELLRFRTTNVMHEHVNFYSPRSLKVLLEQRGLVHISAGTYGQTRWIGGRVTGTEAKQEEAFVATSSR